MTTPTRSLAQRQEALRLANHIRTYRADLKRDIKQGTMLVSTILKDPPAEVLTMKVWALLLAMPKVGRTKANKWLSKSRVSYSKTIEGLSDRQRRELLVLLAAQEPASTRFDRRALPRHQSERLAA